MPESKTKLNKIKKLLVKIPWLVARHAFFSCLVLFLLAVALGMLIFYKYSILSDSASFDNSELPYILDYKTYNNVLDSYKKENQKFEQADLKEYSNPFFNVSEEESVD